MLAQGRQQNDTMIGDGGNSRFMGFELLGLWVFDMLLLLVFFFFFFFGWFFGSSSHWFFGV